MQLEPGRGADTLRGISKRDPFHFLHGIPENIRVTVMLKVRLPCHNEGPIAVRQYAWPRPNPESEVESSGRATAYPGAVYPILTC